MRSRMHIKHETQILPLLLCLIITVATDPSTETSENKESDHALKLSKRDADKFEFLSELGKTIDGNEDMHTDGNILFEGPFRSLDDDDDDSDINDNELDGYSLIGPEDDVDFESDEDLDTQDEDKRAPMGLYGQLGKRAPMSFYGQLGKRAPMGFYGQLGKRAPMGFYGQLGKRAPMGMFGQLGKRAPMGMFGQLGKRAPMGMFGQLGKRAPMGMFGQLGKRAPMGMFGQLGKRAPMGFYGQLGKRAPMGLYGQLGKRAPMGLYGQLGKRFVYSNGILENSDLSGIRERRSAPSWMLNGRQRSRWARGRMIKRPNLRFFPQLG